MYLEKRSQMIDNKNWNVRTELLLGKEKIKKLKQSSVLIAGVGGVGAFVAEYLCRAGVGKITLVDNDVIDITNLNRQLPALRSNLCKIKVEVLAKRLGDINPEAEVKAIHAYLKDEKTSQILESDHFDCVVDAIDTLSPKVHLILACLKLKIKIVSSMGSGGKIDPSKIITTDISKTFNCGLARAVRKKLKKYKIYKGFRAVFSPEGTYGKVITFDDDDESAINKKSAVGTISYMPSAFACHCAAEVIKILTK